MTSYRDQGYDLAVQYDARGFELTEETKQRFEEDLVPLGTILDRPPAALLHVEIVWHPRQERFHVKTCLRIGKARKFFTGDRDPVLAPAFKRCVKKLIGRVERFRSQFDRRHASAAERAPQVSVAVEPSWGDMARAIDQGDYVRFRDALASYEDTLALRVGRVIERFPAASAVLGETFLISEVVEEVFLIAFETFGKRAPQKESLGRWLNELIEPAIKAMLADPDTEKENVAFVQALR